MKRILLFLIVFIAILLLASPYAEGWVFSGMFHDRIELIQQKLKSHKNITLEVMDYKVGWLQSTIKMKVTYAMDPRQSGIKIPPLTFEIDSIVQHGPLLNYENKWQVAAASLNTVVRQAEIVKQFIPLASDNFIKITSIVSLDGSLWTTHYQASATGDAKDMTGEMVVNTILGKPVKVVGSMNYVGTVVPANPDMPFMPHTVIAPMVYQYQSAIADKGVWGGKSDFTSQGFGVKWEDGSIITAGNLHLNTEYGVSAARYFFNLRADLQSLILPPVYPVNNVSNVKLLVDVNDIDIEGMRAYEEYLRSPKMSLSKDRLLYVMKMLSPTSNVKADMSVTTNLGNSDASMLLSLQAMPTAPSEVLANLNADIKAHVPMALASKMVAMYLVHSEDPAADAQMMLDGLLKQGIIVQDQNDYALTLSKKGEVLILNGADVSPMLQQVNMLMQ